MEILLTITSQADRSRREERLEIGSGLAIGRGAEHGLLLDGSDLSREHVLLTEDGGDVYLTDTSVNGTWLNGNRLRKSAKTLVRAGDSIEIPGYVLSFRPGQAAEAVPEAGFGQAAAIADVPAMPSHSSPWALLDPVLRFTSSFTFIEKLLAFVALGGLVLVFTYISS